MGADSDIGVGALLVEKRKSVIQASLESRSPTLAKPLKLWSQQIRDEETIVAGRLGAYQQPTMMNSIGRGNGCGMMNSIGRGTGCGGSQKRSESACGRQHL
jgi:hypothetical protein